MHTIRDFNFQPGALVLIRNTAIEKSLNRKMRARYLGPLVVLAHNRGGAYILAELDGTVLDRPIAAFRVVPYFARREIPIPPGILDIPLERLRELQNSSSQGDDTYEPDFLDTSGREEEVPNPTEDLDDILDLSSA